MVDRDYAQPKHDGSRSSRKAKCLSQLLGVDQSPTEMGVLGLLRSDYGADIITWVSVASWTMEALDVSEVGFGWIGDPT